MQNYDFLILSPPEFEDLTRDLLQEELNVFIESFTDGSDGGIDLRFARLKSEKAIIQCKRYKTFNSLIQNLKKEVDNVKKLKPSRYIISTSVGLTPNQKEKILKLFNPFILSTEDIIGKNDLNNLIGRHKSIELKYTKLWLSSVNVLK
ncbi:MAG: restriction endonuclease [Haliscomenobacter sp.]|nr:restriction endonuclease [Haliscomenobacter sp.]